MINRSSKKAIFEAFDASKSEEGMRLALLRHQETTFLYKQNFGINKLNIFHHLAVIGGNFYNKQEHYGATQGADDKVTCIATPDIQQLLGLSTNETSVPLINDLMEVKLEDEYQNLKTTSRSKYSARNFIAIPPFMLFKINEAILQYDGDSTQVLIAVISVIKEFDQITTSTNEAIFFEKAIDLCKDIVFWLYLASKGKVKSTPTVGCSNLLVRKHFESIEKQLGSNMELSIQAQQHTHMNNFTSSIQQPLEIIASSSSSTQDFLSKLTQIQTASQEKSTHSFGKLSEKIQKMLLIAPLKGNIIPSQLNEKAMSFFSLSNFSKAQQYLESLLESKGIECSIPIAVTDLLLQGYLLWLNPLTPSGLASSVISSKDIIFNNSLYEGILLDFLTKHKISRASLTKLTKTQVIYPTSIELMLERVEAILACVEIFFTVKSYLFQGLNHFLIYVKLIKLSLELFNSYLLTFCDMIN